MNSYTRQELDIHDSIDNAVEYIDRLLDIMCDIAKDLPVDDNCDMAINRISIAVASLKLFIETSDNKLDKINNNNTQK